MHRARKWMRRALRRVGLEVRSLRGMPFGVEWWDDLRFFPDGREIRVVFDVGANRGQTAASVLEHFPGAEVFSFEPVETTFAHLAEFAGRDPRVKAFRLAMGAARGSALMSADPSSGENTLVRSSERVQWSAAAEVPVDTVAGFCAERGIARIDLLKIDTEGYEMQVLRGAEAMLAQGQIGFVLAECDFLRRCHGTGPHGDFVEMLNYLDRFGYALVAFYNGGVDDHGWIWGDALFRLKGGGVGYSWSPFVAAG